MTITIKDFATKIKAKYPEYAQLDDFELTRRIVAKYPEYQAQLDAPISQRPATPVEGNPGLVTRAGEAALNFIHKEGPKIAGAAIGGTIGAPGGPLGVLAGASAGAAGGEGLRQISEQLQGNEQADIPRLQSALVEGPMMEAGSIIGAKFPKVVADAIISKTPLSTQQQLARVLAPTTKETKFLTGKVIPRLAEEKMVAATLPRLAEKVSKAKSAAGAEIDRAFANIPSGLKLKTKPITDAMDRAKQQFTVNNVEVLPAATAKLDELKTVIEQLGPSVPAESLRKTRQVWDMIVDMSGGFGGKDLKASSEVFAQKQAADAIRRQIGKVFPDIKALNAEFTFWSRVDDILQARIEREAGRSLSMTDLISGGSAIGAAAAGANPLVLTLPLVVRAMQSTGWRTTSAAVKKTIAEAIDNGNFAAASALASRIAATGGE